MKPKSVTAPPFFGGELTTHDHMRIILENLSSKRLQNKICFFFGCPKSPRCPKLPQFTVHYVITMAIQSHESDGPWASLMLLE